MLSGRRIRNAGGMSDTRRGYGRFWRGVLPELGFLLPTLPVAIVSGIVLMTVFWLGSARCRSSSE